MWTFLQSTADDASKSVGSLSWTVAIGTGAATFVYVFRKPLCGWLLRVLVRTNAGKGADCRTGLFAPVHDEVRTAELRVEGSIPRALNGVYLRTGANPQFEPIGGYHWFDGEAMIHAVRLQDGKALCYTNHWLRCPRFLHEEKAGYNLFARAGDSFGLFGVLIVFLDWVSRPVAACLRAGQAGNTAIAYHAGRLLALMETGYPFALRMLRNGRLSSMGFLTYGGKLTHSVTAHPKIDPVTGEMCLFGYNPTPPDGKAVVLYNTVSPSGGLSEDVNVFAKPQMMHDFAVTENYAVFFDHNLVFDPENMVRKNTLPYTMDIASRCRIGLLERRGSQRLRWIAADTMGFVAHFANAWEEGDLIRVVLVRYPTFELANMSARYGRGILTRYDINLRTAKVTATELLPETPAMAVEFPVVAEVLQSRPCSRVCFCGFTPVDHTDRKPPNGVMRGVLKVDMHAAAGKGVLARIDMPPGVHCGELSFVPRNPAALARSDTADDDGYLVGFATSEGGQSFLMVYDAKSMAEAPVGKVSLPYRVPFGFHGKWLSQADFEVQLNKSALDAGIDAPLGAA